MKCRICSDQNFESVLDLGLQPWGNHFLTEDQIGKEPFYPLKLIYCKSCGCVQLDYTVPKEVMFKDHTYVSGTTKTLSDHFRKTAEYVDSEFFTQKPGKSVLDIGSNDGTQLKHYKDLGYDCLGVEPCERVANIANENGLKTLVEFFNRECVEKVGRKFDVINASGVFFHLEELHSAADGVKAALAEGGVFVVQFLYMKKIVENLAFDQIYHEHLLYYTLATLNRLLGLHGLELFDAYISDIHGGSAIAFATHKGQRKVTPRLSKLYDEEQGSAINSLSSYQTFAKKVEKLKAKTLEYLNQKKSEGKTIFGFGAPVKGNTFLNYCGIGTNYLDCLVEKNPLRKGLCSPGMHIPIVLEEELKQPPDVYFVLAWNFKDEILRNNQKLIEAGVEFYFPVVF